LEKNSIRLAVFFFLLRSGFLISVRNVFRKYRNTEPAFLVGARGITILVLLVLLGGYFAILTYLLATDGDVIKSSLQPSTTIPIPDGSESTSQECSQYVLQPSCNNVTSDDRWHGYFTATEDLVFNQTEKRYAMYFTINIDDPRYDRTNDKGMMIKAFDSEFNPLTVPLSVNKSANDIDGEFYQSLDDLNLHVIGFQQMNWMFITRHIRKKEISNFWTLLGIPPQIFDEKYITSNYESVTNPPNTQPVFANQSITGQQLYANLFVGTMNWFVNVETEGKLVFFTIKYSHPNHKSFPKFRVVILITDSLSLLAGFYGLLIGIYILLFGFSPVHPWGLCQSFFLRRRIKKELHKQYPKSIPLLERPSDDETLTERINYLEQFLKQFFCDVSIMADIKGENDLNNFEDTVEDTAEKIENGKFGKH
ncbi:14600_t:CDS:2, partial [Dentiscutata erythropus]